MAGGMHPDLPEDDKVLDNPYTYTEYKSAATREARGIDLRRPGVVGSGGTLSLDDREAGKRWPDAERVPTSSRRWLAGSTCWPASTPTTAP